jgi:hypothetical protein
MKRTGFALMIVLGILIFFAYSIVPAQAVSGANGGNVVEVQPENGSLSPDWGTTSSSSYTIHATEMVPPSSSVTWATQNNNYISIYQTSTSQVDWWAPVHLPQGAIMTSIELEACDSTASGAILFGMAKMVAPGVSGGSGNITSVGSTGLAATPGCSFFPLNLTTPTTVDNSNDAYLVFVDWSGVFANTNRAIAVRVFYKLQVSPAPATATFNDVPTSHPFFQYIEALANSGITSGCGGGSYCPDNYVTRGQMAVFLSKALGLYWPY